MFNMLAYCKILRPLNCAMTSLAILIGGFLAVRIGFTLQLTYNILFAMLAGFLIAGAGNVINDYIDFKADRVNKPDRPIPSGDIKRKTALLYAIVLFSAGIVLAAFINWVALTIAVINSFLLVLYSLKLQNKIFLGNGAVSILVGSSFLFGGASVENIYVPSMLFILAFLTNFSREIIKDMEDLEGDKWEFLLRTKEKIKESVSEIAERFGVKHGKIFLKYSKRFAKSMASFMLLIAVAFSPTPYLFGLLSFTYIIILVPADILFIISAFDALKAKNVKDFRKISKNIKIGMFFGLIAFMIGVTF